MHLSLQVDNLFLGQLVVFLHDLMVLLWLGKTVFFGLLGGQQVVD